MTFDVRCALGEGGDYKSFVLPVYVRADEQSNHAVTLRRIMAHVYIASQVDSKTKFKVTYAPTQQVITINSKEIFLDQLDQTQRAETKNYARERKSTDGSCDDAMITIDGLADLSASEVAALVKLYQESEQAGQLQAQAEFAHNPCFLLLSAVLSFGAAYKAYVGTYLFSTQKKYYLNMSSEVAELCAVIGALPSLTFYTKSLSLMLTKIYTGRLGWNWGRLTANAIMGTMYGLSSYGMLESADSLDINNITKELLHDCVLVVNVFLGMHKSDVIYRYAQEMLSFISSKLWFEQARPLVHLSLLRQRRETIIRDLTDDSKKLPGVELTNRVSLTWKLLDEHVSGITALVPQVSDVLGRQLLDRSSQVFPLLRYYVSDIPAYSLPYVFCNTKYDLAMPVVLLVRLLARLISIAIASFAIVSNIGGISFFMSDTLNWFSDQDLPRVFLSTIFSLAVLGLNLKDTKKYIEAKILGWVNQPVSIDVRTPLNIRQRFVNTVFSMNALAFMVSLWAATQGVVYTKNTLDVWKTSASVEIFILSSTLMLMTSTKMKPLLYLLCQLRDRLFGCISGGGGVSISREAQLRVSQLDDHLFGLMKTYCLLLKRHNLWVASQDSRGVNALDSRKCINEVNDEMQRISNQADNQPTLDLRLRLFDVLQQRCESLEQGISTLSVSNS